MQDPFADNSKQKLYREAQAWMAVLACLMIAFLYLAVKRMTGSADQIPEHILQSGVAHVTAPIEYDPNLRLVPARPNLKSVPQIPTNTNSSGDLISAPRVRSNSTPANIFSQPAPKRNIVAESFPVPQQPAPKPTFEAPVKLATAESDDDAAAEAIGRERVKQLAALTSGLPKRLNRIQSSIKRTTAELPVEFPSPDDNRFAPIASSKSASESLGHPPVATPAKPIPLEPIVEKTIAESPTVEKVIPAKPIPAEPFSFKPIPLPDPQTTETEKVTIEKPSENSFVPVPVVKRLPKPMLSKNSAAIHSQSTPKPKPKLALKPQPKPLPKAESPENVDSLKQLQHASPTSPQHIVETGDSFFTIAQQHYGDGQWFRALHLANQALVKDVDVLPAGLSLSIPSTEELARRFPDQAVRNAASQPTEAQRRIYVTQAGDTLFDIARRKTGQGAQFSEIIRQNEFVLPTKIGASDWLPAGLRLVLPESTLQ